MHSTLDQDHQELYYESRKHTSQLILQQAHLSELFRMFKKQQGQLEEQREQLKEQGEQLQEQRQQMKEQGEQLQAKQAQLQQLHEKNEALQQQVDANLEGFKKFQRGFLNLAASPSK